jgi:16S rRNA (cytosine1402-N4)-methyltransferase
MAELVQAMNISADGIYIDCTGGGGGHAEAVRQKLTTGKIYVLDRDPDAIERLNQKFAGDPQVVVVQENFRYLPEVVDKLGIGKVNGIYADFGVSSFQLLEGERGFSLRRDGELDMRMNPDDGESAKDVVNNYSEELLGEIIYRYGEEKFFRRVAKAIVTRRNIKQFSNTIDLANVVKGAVPAKFHKVGSHPATKTFQALRIHVNQELVAIESLLRGVEDLVVTGGRVAFISFHSLEDRLVKEYLVRYEKPCTCPPEFPICACGRVPSFNIITRKPIAPTDKEIKDNPLSRSAKLRVGEKI